MMLSVLLVPFALALGVMPDQPGVWPKNPNINDTCGGVQGTTFDMSIESYYNYYGGTCMSVLIRNDVKFLPICQCIAAGILAKAYLTCGLNGVMSPQASDEVRDFAQPNEQTICSAANWNPDQPAPWKPAPTPDSKGDDGENSSYEVRVSLFQLSAMALMTLLVL